MKNNFNDNYKSSIDDTIITTFSINSILNTPFLFCHVYLTLGSKHPPLFENLKSTRQQ